MSAVSGPVVSAPTAAAPTESYVVVAGDSLSAIAVAFGLTLDTLVATNGWADGGSHVINTGDVIALPPEASTQVQQSTTKTTTPLETNASAPVSAPVPDPAGYREVGPERLLSVGDDGTTALVKDPLADGVYYASQYAVTPDGAAVQFDLARFISTEACIAALDGADEFWCDGGQEDTSATATITMPRDADVSVVLVTADYRYFEVTAEEFARLLSGEPKAPDAPDSFEFQADWSAMVEVAQGTVVRANQRPSS